MQGFVELGTSLADRPDADVAFLTRQSINSATLRSCLLTILEATDRADLLIWSRQLYIDAPANVLTFTPTHFPLLCDVY